MMSSVEPLLTSLRRMESVKQAILRDIKAEFGKFDAGDSGAWGPVETRLYLLPEFESVSR